MLGPLPDFLPPGVVPRLRLPVVAQGPPPAGGAVPAGPEPAAVPAAAPEGGGVLGWLADLALRPGVVETVLGLLLCAVAVIVWLRLIRIIDRVRTRALLHDYLLGVEQALGGDLVGARQRLERVLQADPENHYARLCYGKVLAAQGEHAQAHKHHLFLQSAFLVQSVDNDLQLARALAAVGRPADAADVADRALQREPRHAGLLEFLFRMRLQSGEPAAAAAAGRRWLAALPAVARDRAKAEVAEVTATAGLLRLRTREIPAAQALLRDAETLTAEAPLVRLLAGRLGAVLQGPEATAKALLAEPGGVPARAPLATAPARAGAGTAPAAPPPSALAGAQWLERMRPLLPIARWHCGSCGSPMASARTHCSRCGAQDSAEALESRLFEPIEQPALVVDAIERNTAHVRRTVRTLLDAPPAAQAAARTALLDLGDGAIGELLAQALPRGGAAIDLAIDLLRELGPSSTGALFAAAAELDGRRSVPGAALMTVVGRVVQGFDRQALPHVEAQFASSTPQLRKVLIEFFLGLADPDEFEVVLERFPPLEILQALNKVDAPVLRRFLRAMPAGHFVVDVLLLQDAFYREDEVLLAIQGAERPEVLEDVLRRRGPTRTLLRQLLGALEDAELRPVARRLLLQFGERVLDHVIAAFVDRERDAAVRTELAALLTDFGAAAVERLCAGFGPEPAALDDDLLAVIVGMGGGAVDALAQAYGRPGLLERMTRGLLRRGTNKKQQIVRALSAIGTVRAQRVLQRLRETEADANLKLRLQQALHRIEEAGARPDDASDAPGITGAAGGAKTTARRDDDAGHEQGGGHGQVG